MQTIPNSPQPIDCALLEWRSARRFQSTPIAESTLRELLELAVHAPCSRLAQPWRFSVPGKTTRTRLTRIAHDVTRGIAGSNAALQTAKMLHQAPALVAVSVLYTNSQNIRAQREDYAAVCCAIQNLTLAAHARGLAIWWRSGYVVRHANTASLFKLGANEELVGLLHIGYPIAGVYQNLKPASNHTRWLE